MKKFILESLIFLSIFILLIAYVIGKDNRFIDEKVDYVDAISDKHEYLNSIDGNRLILAGGSNVPFGFDSKVLSNLTGKNTINLGLHAGFGYRFALKELELSLDSGDIVILSIEYLNQPIYSYELMMKAAKNYPKAYEFFERNIYHEINHYLKYKFKNIFIFNIKLLQGRAEAQKINRNPNSLYTKNSFNQFGDIVKHRNLKTPPKIDMKIFNYRKWEMIEELNTLNKNFRNRNIRLLFQLPIIPETIFNKNEEVLQKIYQDLISELEVPIINTLENSVYPDSLFFDTKYHLNNDGIVRRTEETAEQLNPLL